MAYPGRGVYGRRRLPPPPTRPDVLPPPPIGYPLGLGALGGALGAISGTFACLLCLSAIAALGLFACVVAITAYTRNFLYQYKEAEELDGAPEQVEIGFILVLVSLSYIIICRMH
ncbi:unnamed protein product [Rotaria sp. Silwood2]|nr:unnamed protein product [Rotaria sp. Silwood2]